jgi:hypothetical protein
MDRTTFFLCLGYTSSVYRIRIASLRINDIKRQTVIAEDMATSQDRIWALSYIMSDYSGV